MAEYRIGKKGLDLVLKRSIAISLVSLVFVLILVWVLNRNSLASGDNTILYVLPVVTIFILISTWRSARKQRKILEALCVTITDEEISFQQIGGHRHSISFMEVREIIKTSKGHYIIRGEGGGNKVMLPAYLEGGESLEAELRKFGEIKVDVKDPFKRKLYVPLSILGLASFICVFFVDNKIVVGIAGPIAFVLLAVAFRWIQTHKAVPPKIKRRYWWMLLALIAVVVQTFLKLK